ncbi:DMT family transporter, partial [Bordetella hinzii]|nr:DMT family transporter [Bordetella hinzii]
AAGLEAALGGMVPWADPRLALTLLFLALVPSLGAYYAYGKLVRRAGPGTAGLSMFLVPAYAALLSWPLLGEAPRPYHAMGFALILAGVRLASFKRRAGGGGGGGGPRPRPRRPPPPPAARPTPAPRGAGRGGPTLPWVLGKAGRGGAGRLTRGGGGPAGGPPPEALSRASPSARR